MTRAARLLAATVILSAGLFMDITAVSAAGKVCARESQCPPNEVCSHNNDSFVGKRLSGISTDGVCLPRSLEIPCVDAAACGDSRDCFKPYTVGLLLGGEGGPASTGYCYTSGTRVKLDPTQNIDIVRPKLEIEIPGVSFSEPVKTGGFVTLPFLSDYIAGVYNFLVSIVGAVAAAMIMIGGFQYLTAGGDKTRVEAGKKRIKDALLGLVLVLGSYAMLYAINPNLVNFESLKLADVSTEFSEDFLTGVPDDMPVTTSSGTAGSSSGTTAPPPAASGAIWQACKGDACVAVCRDDFGCKDVGKIEDGTCDVAKANAIAVGKPGILKSGSPELIKATDTKNWPPMLNIKVSKSAQATKAAIEGLQRADKYLSDPNKSYGAKGYTVKVTTCWRDWLEPDTMKECAIVLGNHVQGGVVDKNPTHYYLAWPGASPHSAGYACDMRLLKDGKEVAGDKKTENCKSVRPFNDIFVEIMTNPDVGGRRLDTESWHFEWGGPTGCRCVGEECHNIWPITVTACKGGGGSTKGFKTEC